MTETILHRPEWGIKPEPYYERKHWFFDSWRRRHDLGKNVIICATGQSLGIGKSYWLLSSFEEVDPDITIEQVVFSSKQFWDTVEGLPVGEWHPIMWDDPTRGLQKRDWYKDVNKTITSFMKTASRYKRRDLGFAVPSMDDLDIAIREIMTLEAQMKEAGLSKLHRIKRNRFGTPPFWKPYLGEVSRPIPKLASQYEKRREEFHKDAYKEQEFADKNEEAGSLQVFYRVYREVKAKPSKFMEAKRGIGKEELSVLLISALSDPPCSDQIARKVKTRIEHEGNGIASEPNTSASVAS